MLQYLATVQQASVGSARPTPSSPERCVRPQFFWGAGVFGGRRCAATPQAFPCFFFYFLGGIFGYMNAYPALRCYNVGSHGLRIGDGLWCVSAGIRWTCINPTGGVVIHTRTLCGLACPCPARAHAALSAHLSSPDGLGLGLGLGMDSALANSPPAKTAPAAAAAHGVIVQPVPGGDGGDDIIGVPGSEPAASAADDATEQKKKKKKKKKKKEMDIVTKSF